MNNPCANPHVLLVDDHVMFAQALRVFLESEFKSVACAADGLQLLEAIKKQRIDVIIADIEMPRLNGLQALRQLRSEGFDAKVIFLTMHAEPAFAREALAAGAAGYVLKDSAGEELIAAVKQVANGNMYISPRIAQQVMSATSTRSAGAHQRITLRQREVLELVITGLTMKEVAATLHLSRRTVETHKYDIMHILGVGNTAELVQYALRNCLVGEYSAANSPS